MNRKIRGAADRRDSSPFEGAGDRPVHFVHKDAIEKERKRDIIKYPCVCDAP